MFLFDQQYINSLLIRKHTFPLVVTTTQQLQKTIPWLQKISNVQEALYFFGGWWISPRLFLFGYVSLSNCPLAGPNSLIIQVKAGQTLGEAASGGSISAPRLEVLQTSLCAAHCAVSPGEPICLHILSSTCLAFSMQDFNFVSVALPLLPLLSPIFPT